jgi:hypothetical protein
VNSPNPSDGSADRCPDSPPLFPAPKDVGKVANSPNRRTFLISSAAAVGAVVRGFDKKAAMYAWAVPAANGDMSTAATDTGDAHLGSAYPIAGVNTLTAESVVQSGPFVQATTPATAPGTSTIPWKIHSDSTHPDWNFVVDLTASSTGNLQTFEDPVMFIGWNIQAGGAKEDVTRWAWHLTLEYDYWTNISYDRAWHHQPEAHLQFHGANGTVIRLFSANVNAALNQSTFTIAADYWNLANSAGIQLMNYAAGVGPIYFGADLAVHGSVTAGNGTGQPNFTLACNATSHGDLNWFSNDIGNYWQIQGRRDSSNQLWFRDGLHSRNPLVISPGATALTSLVSISDLVRFADSTLFQATVGAPGPASAPPATPAKYLKVQDNVGTTYAIPCYAAS